MVNAGHHTVSSVCSVNRETHFNADIIQESTAVTRETFQSVDRPDCYVEFEKFQSYENSPIIAEKYSRIPSEQTSEDNVSRVQTKTDPGAIFKVNAMRRQFSDNGHESGIGSDSDSGNSAVFFDGLNPAAAYNFPNLTQAIYHQDSIVNAFVPSSQAKKDFDYSSSDKSLDQYADLATPLDDVEHGYDQYETRTNVTLHAPNKLSAHSSALGLCEEMIHKDSAQSVNNEREKSSKKHAFDKNVQNVVSRPSRIFHDARRQLSFERSRSSNQPIREQSPFKRSSSSDNKPNEMQYLSSSNVQDQKVRGQKSRVRGDSSPGLTVKNHPLQSQSSVIDIDWLAQKNLAKRIQEITLASNSWLSSPMSEAESDVRENNSMWPVENHEATSSCVEQDLNYTPEQLRRQYASLQMRLSQDFSNSPNIHRSTAINGSVDFTNDQSSVAAAIAAKKQLHKHKYTSAHAAFSSGSYNQPEINNNDIDFVHPTVKVNCPVVGTDEVYQTPTRQLSGSGFVRRVAFEDDQPATLPRAVPRATTTTYVEISPGSTPKKESPRSLFNWKSGIAEAKRRWAGIGHQQEKTREAVKAVENFSAVGGVSADSTVENTPARSPSTDLNRSPSNLSVTEEKLRTPIRLRKNRSVASSPSRGATAIQLVRGLSTRVTAPGARTAGLDRQTSAPAGVTTTTDTVQNTSSAAPKVTHKPPIPKSKSNGGHYFKNHPFFSHAAAKKKSKSDGDKDSVGMATVGGAETGHEVAEETSFISSKPIAVERASIAVKMVEESLSHPVTSSLDEVTDSRTASPVPSVTGRTRTTFQTFHGEPQPITWKEDSNLPAQKIINGITVSSASTIEDPKIEDHEKNKSNTNKIHKSIIATNHATEKDLAKFLSLKLSKPASLTSDASKPRSVSYSENINSRNDKSIHKRVKQSKVVSFNTSVTSTEDTPPSVCDPPTTPDQHALRYGQTDCDQAVEDITTLMNLIDSSLIETSPTRERTITAREFNEARDAFKTCSRTFVCDCRQLVTSAGRTRSEFTACLAQSMRTFATLVERSHRMILCLSAPSDKTALSDRVHDLADAFRMTILAVWRVVGKRLDDAGCRGELKREVSGLTGALGRLVHTLMNLDYEALVRRF